MNLFILFVYLFNYLLLFLLLILFIYLFIYLFSLIRLWSGPLAHLDKRNLTGIFTIGKNPMDLLFYLLLIFKISKI